jgi:dGTPase
VFWEGVETGGPKAGSKNDFGSRAFQLMSANYKVVFENASKQVGSGGAASIAHQKMQLLTDQISGMTDTFACSLHKRLFNS